MDGWMDLQYIPSARAPKFLGNEEQNGWMNLQYTSQRAPPKMPGGSLLCEGEGTKGERRGRSDDNSNLSFFS